MTANNDTPYRLRYLAADIQHHGLLLIDPTDTAALLNQAAAEIDALRQKLWIGHRTTDPDTSRDAAPKFKNLRQVHFQLLGAFIRYGDLTADEAGEICGLVNNRSCYWKRVSELVSIGYLVDTGERRNGLAGKPQSVRGLSRLGKDAYDAQHEAAHEGT